jgi:D-tagatose-1,6-bisphosphate aldolase subunit GatZ/KbaZ
MKLGDDPPGELDVEVVAGRAARLAGVAEEAFAHSESREGQEAPRYVIGTEVPIPGGATSHEEGLAVTQVQDVRRTIDVTREAFSRAGLQPAWERVIAVVVQPGVEFGDDFVLPYQPEAARELSQFIEGEPLIYEAHSTDYQSRATLQNLVRDHFGILKVGPALTFAFREAVFSLAMIEDDLFPLDERSHLIRVLDDVMVRKPEHWKRYYPGDAREQAFKRKFSLSDRIRYYWVQPEVQLALAKLKRNLEGTRIPSALLSQYLPFDLEAPSVVEGAIAARLSRVLDDYRYACGPRSD